MKLGSRRLSKELAIAQQEQDEAWFILLHRRTWTTSGLCHLCLGEVRQEPGRGLEPCPQIRARAHSTRADGRNAGNLQLCVV